MPYHYEWLCPKRVIFCYVSGEQTREEVERSFAEMITHLDSGEPLTHFIVDLRHNQKIPGVNALELKNMASFLSHPHLGWIVVVGRNHPARDFVLTLVTKLTRVRYRAVDEPQEAVAFLSTIDPTLDLNVDLEVFYAAFIQQSHEPPRIG